MWAPATTGVTPGFRSLFSWITHVGAGHVSLSRPAATIFRSLFSWITHVGAYTPPPGDSNPEDFDPCSPGSRTSGPYRTSGPRRPADISILVLLDHARRGCMCF